MSECPMRPCEVCGDDAIEFVQDIKEVAPKRDGGSLWRQWERDGPRRFFCLNHMRAGKQTELSGEERAKLCLSI